MKISLNGRSPAQQIVAKEFVMTLEPNKMSVSIDGIVGQHMTIDINEFLAAIECVRSYYAGEDTDE
jgi:hypothetical protein